MKIYPAIDIKNGVCVRLRMGDMDQATEYGDPAEIALTWQSLGAQFLHIVDLDAAFSGTFSNYDTVAKIIDAVSIPVQLGGGVRTMEDIEVRIKELKVNRVVLGTAAFENPELISEAAAKYPGRIVAGIDAKEGKVAVRGWVTVTGVNPVYLALELKDSGIKTIIYTDISKDGMLSGPNIKGIEEMVKKTGMNIIASGGVSVIDDVLKVKEAGAEGVIIGKALYAGSISLQDAIDTGTKGC